MAKIDNPSVYIRHISDELCIGVVMLHSLYRGSRGRKIGQSKLSAFEFSGTTNSGLRAPDSSFSSFSVFLFPFRVKLDNKHIIHLDGLCISSFKRAIIAVCSANRFRACQWPASGFYFYLLLLSF